jgi:hypothetical protein
MTGREMIADSEAEEAAVDATAEEIAVAGSVVEADAIAAAVRMDVTCLRRSMRRRDHLVRHIHRTDHFHHAILKVILRRRAKVCRQLFYRANRLRNIRSVHR